jgi:hypothetical protein
VSRGKLRSVEVRDSFGYKRYLVAEAELERLERLPDIDLALYLTPSEFGQRVGLTAKSVTARVQRGSIRAIRSPRRVRYAAWLIPETEVQRFLARHREAEEPPRNVIPFPGAPLAEARVLRPPKLPRAA